MRRALGISTVALAAFAACRAPRGDEGRAPPRAAEASAPLHETALGERGEAHVALAPIGDAREGGAVSLARLGGSDRRLAFVVDEDEASLVTVDVDARLELSRTRVEGRPGQVLVGADGLVYTSLRDAAAVVALRPEVDGSLVEVARASTPLEPLGLGRAEGPLLLVACGAGHALAAFDARTLAPRFSVDLPRAPRAVAVASGDCFAVVMHAVGGVVSRVALDDAHQVVSIRLDGRDAESFAAPSGDAPGAFAAARFEAESTRVRRSVAQGFSLARAGDRVLAPAVIAHREEGEAPTPLYGLAPGQGFLPEEPTIIDVDADRPKALLRTRESVDAAGYSRQSTNGAAAVPLEHPCLLPRAAVYDAKRDAVLVGCLGEDQVVAFDASPRPLEASARARWSVPAGVAGLAIDPEAREVFVWSSFARVLSSLAIDARAGVVAPGLVLPPRASSSEATRLGRRLFHASDPRISSDARSCASCHPEGRDDGLVWSTPSGPRRTPSLAGRLEGTAPYGWGGESATAHDHLEKTVKRLGGKGLRAREIDALLSYVSALAPPPRRGVDARAERGGQLFRSERFGCVVCHEGDGRGVDARAHDVGSGASFDTPSLRFVASAGPYFHDGRFATLGALLRETRGTMGSTEGASDADLEAIAAYLETL